jgi:hypothetical protein
MTREECAAEIKALWQRYHALCRVDSTGAARLPLERYDEAKAIFAQMRELQIVVKQEGSA